MTPENLRIKFEQECIRMDRFHKNLISTLPEFDHNNPLLFLELDGLKFFHTELIPERIKDRGYDPEKDPQTIVLGTMGELENWIKEKGLNKNEFTIEPSWFGFHIDIYGQDVDLLTGSEKNRLTEARYSKLLNGR